MCFICAGMDVTTQLELCLHEQTQLVANAIGRVGYHTQQRINLAIKLLKSGWEI